MLSYTYTYTVESLPATFRLDKLELITIIVSDRTMIKFYVVSITRTFLF